MFSNAPDRPANDETKSDYVDVLIIGAGISGLGAAYELKQQCPEQSFAILEGFESYGGTWLWHKYPGIRSDSDLFTFGYRFKPWLGAPIASGAEILKYLGEVIEENNLAPHIRYRHRVQTASWDSRTNLWTVVALRGEEQDPITLRCRFLWMCQGYYRHSKGYTPDWPGMSEFEGRIVHPQTWPQALDYEGKRVIVIGSGATAATVVPAIAADCDHVTLLQRSPTYFSPGVNRHWLADALREIGVDETTIHDVVRRKIVFDQYKFLQRSINDPESAKADLLKGVLAYLPQEVVDKHFTPNYRPWRQRIAVVPDGDLFESVNAGKVSVVTDNIERFTKSGIALKSGDHIDADIIVTATGFDLCVLGDIAFSIDGKPLQFSETVTYRGMMFTGVPNMAWIFGYFRAASWTLRVDMVADFVCRLLNHMAARDVERVEVALRPEDADMALLPWIDDEVFNPGYLMRGMHLLPKRGAKPEWAHSQDYWWERDVLPKVDLDDPAFVYSGKRATRPPPLQPQGRDRPEASMLRFSILLRRRANLSRVEFLRYWREQHAPLVKALSSDLGIRRYVQIHTLSPDELAVAGLPPEAENTYDGLAEVWFDGAAEALARTPQAKAARRQLRVDEEKFIDVATSISWWATSFVVVDERSGD